MLNNFPPVSRTRFHCGKTLQEVLSFRTKPALPSSAHVPAGVPDLSACLRLACFYYSRRVWTLVHSCSYIAHPWELPDEWKIPTGFPTIYIQIWIQSERRSKLGPCAFGRILMGIPGRFFRTKVGRISQMCSRFGIPSDRKQFVWMTRPLFPFIYWLIIVGSKISL